MRGLDGIAARVLRARWALVGALAPRREVRTRDLRLTLRVENWITHYRWATYEEKEPETLDWIDSDLRDGDLLIDVGANIGVYTVYAALRHAGLRVIAFEPEVANAHLLRDNIVANRVADRVDAYAVALGAHEGLGTLLVQDLTPGAALHSLASAAADRTPDGRRVVFRQGVIATTLDRFCERASCRPNALKIDVDGTEPEILAGAAATLAAPELRTVLIEMPAVVEDAVRCRTLLAAAGLRRIVGRISASGNEIWSR